MDKEELLTALSGLLSDLNRTHEPDVVETADNWLQDIGLTAEYSDVGFPIVVKEKNNG